MTESIGYSLSLSHRFWFHILVSVPVCFLFYLCLDSCSCLSPSLSSLSCLVCLAWQLYRVHHLRRFYLAPSCMSPSCLCHVFIVSSSSSFPCLPGWGFVPAGLGLVPIFEQACVHMHACLCTCMRMRACGHVLCACVHACARLHVCLRACVLASKQAHGQAAGKEGRKIT